MAAATPPARRGPRRRTSSTPGRSRRTRSDRPPASVFPAAPKVSAPARRARIPGTPAASGPRTGESARVYLHLANDWLAGEYRRAAGLTGADTAAVAEMLAVQTVAVR